MRTPTAGSGPVSIRDYTAEDERAWLDCWARLTVTSHAWGLPAYQSKPRYARAAVELVTVPVAAASIVGLIDVEIENKPGELGLLTESRCGFVWELGLAPECRGLGLGRRLIAAAAERLRDRGIGRMEFWSMDEKAQAFYGRLGMREINRHWRFWVRPVPDSVVEALRAARGGLAGPAGRPDGLTPGLGSLAVAVLHATCDVADWPAVQEALPVASEPPLEPHLCRGFDYRF